MKKNAITAEHLSFAYEKTPVLENISFSIAEKEFIGVIGPNGGGKTTLLKLIMGFLKPLAGKIEIFGESPQASRGQMAYVPQSMRFDRAFPISVLELVLSGRLSTLPWWGQFRQKDHAAALEALERVNLADFQHHPFGTLSGGQAQRALIARALISHPNLLILDEPTASVDAQAEADIYEILMSLRQQMTIVMVTHNLKAAIELFDRVLCVQRNAMFLQPKEVCEHFAIGLYHPPLVKWGAAPQA